MMISIDVGLLFMEKNGDAVNIAKKEFRKGNVWVLIYKTRILEI